jgi:antitoxin MazE
MKIEFLKWGNSLAVRVPKAFARELGAAAGTQADMTIQNGILQVRIAQPAGQRRYLLENLVNAITKENCHRETDWGPPRGDEVW